MPRKKGVEKERINILLEKRILDILDANSKNRGLTITNLILKEFGDKTGEVPNIG